MSTTRNRSLPESYRQLSQFAVRLAAGETLYAAGASLDRFYIVLSGRVRLARPSAGGTSTGTSTALGDATRGQLLGHVAALEGRATQTVATVVEAAVLIAIPVQQMTDAFESSPELAIEVARDLAARVSAEVAGDLPSDGLTPLEAPVASDAPPSDTASPDQPAAGGEATAPSTDPASTAPRPVPGRRAAPPAAPSVAPVSTGTPVSDGWAPSLTKLNIEFDESFFYQDQTECPACGSRFEYLRVRTAGVRPQHRDSDFHVSYSSEDPTRYGIVVCPTCSFAATHEDFGELNEQERAAIVGARHQRGRYDYPNLGGVRDLEDSLIALDLAQACYALRAESPRRDAVLKHRRAWVERERGDEAAELEWLEQARDAYRRSFELDGEISEESAMRVAYLIGDLSLRLGEPQLGAQWLETATRFPEAKQQSGLARLARDRLSDARQLLAELEAERRSA